MAHDVDMVTATASGGVAMSDDHLVRMLQAIRDREGAAGPLDSKVLGRSLGWTAAITAASLDAAKARLLVWGIRVGGTPSPSFEEIELTVQGRRLLRQTTTGRD